MKTAWERMWIPMKEIIVILLVVYKSTLVNLARRIVSLVVAHSKV
jgi:hypothetical protein